MFGNILTVVSLLFPLFYGGANREKIQNLIYGYLSNIAITSGGSFVSIKEYLSIDERIIDLLAWIIIILFSAILSIFVKILTSEMSTRKFKPMLSAVRAVTNKHIGLSCDNAYDLQIFLCEIRSIFCRNFNTNEIGVSVFILEQIESSAVMTQKVAIDFYGIVSVTEFDPAQFSYGEGILGHAWHKKETTLGNRKLLWVFYHPKYKRIKNQNDSANSFCCIPIADKKRNDIVFCAVSIESSSATHFNWRAKMDKTYFDISKEVSKVIAKYIKNIYGELSDDLLRLTQERNC